MNAKRTSHFPPIIVLVVLVGSAPTPSRGAELKLQPVSATGPSGFSILGNQIFLNGPMTTVTLEIKVSGWAPEILEGYQATIDSPGYTSGQGALAPITTPDPSAGAFIDDGRADFVFFGFTAFSAVDTSSLNYRYGSTVALFPPGPTDPGTERYCGTLILDVTGATGGTFEIGFVDDPDFTFLYDDVAIPILPLSLVPAFIRIGPRPIFVDASAGGFFPTGESWSSAFQNLQDALDIADVGNEIWVAEGTYKPDQGGDATPGDRSATFQLIDGVAIYGGFPSGGGDGTFNARNGFLNITVLSGDIGTPLDTSDNSFHVVTGSGNDDTAVLDGVLIAAGNANGFASTDQRGGGVFILNGSPKFRICNITTNQATFGGGMAVFNNSNPTITRCAFTDNEATSNGGAMYNFGDLANQPAPIIRDSTFINNSVTGASGGGGAVRNFRASPKFIDCVFDGNTALSPANGPGAVFNSGSPTEPVFLNCIFRNNEANAFGGVTDNFGQTDVQFINCAFWNNTCGADGGAIVLSEAGTDVTVTNCTFAKNHADGSGGGLVNNGGALTVTNSIVWGNTDSGGMDESAQIDPQSGTTTITYSRIQGWTGVLGDSSSSGADPQLADIVAGDLTVLSGSSAIDAGDTTALPQDDQDLDLDFDFLERLPLDLSGSARVIDDTATVDTGVPGSAVVDIGAYEFSADCNNNGVLDGTDIALGTSQDCNNNGNPDECDIAQCAGDPDCGDCNVNGIPDECDIASEDSDDVDLNGIPDECSGFDGGCGMGTNDWSCNENWEDDTVPNNGATTFSVTLDGTDDAFLDIDVTIDSLEILDSAILSVTQTGTDGDLDIVAGGLRLEGTLLINNGRVIVVSPNPMTVGGGGVYKLQGAARVLETPGTGTIITGDLKLERDLSPDCPPTCKDGGRLSLTSSMEVTIEGDFILNGRGATPCDMLPRGGVIPPPDWSTTDGSKLSLIGNLVATGSASVDVSSTQDVEIGGNFDNFIDEPSCFDWSTGALTLTGLEEFQTFEAAGRNLGPSVTGFAFGSDTNFSMDTLTVATGAKVTFQNVFPNVSGAGPCEEAVYVRDLILESGSRIELVDVRMYYEMLTDLGATIVTEGCGALKPIGPCALNSDCVDGNTCSDDTCDTGTGLCVIAPLASLAAGDITANGLIDVDDILCILSAFSGNVELCPMERADLSPCGGGNGVIDVDDILETLRAFAGTSPCLDLCP